MGQKHYCILISNWSKFKRKLSTKYTVLVICLGLMIFTMWERVCVHRKTNNSFRYENIDRHPDSMKYMLFWTPQDYAPFYFFDEGQKGFINKKCSTVNCFVTANRRLFGGDLTKFDAIAFNGRNVDDKLDMPKIRLARQKYIFFSTESADNYPVCSNIFDNFFNWTATYRLDSDILFSYIKIKNKRGEVIRPKRKMEWPKEIVTDKELDYRGNKTKAVAWFVSNCKSRSNRMWLAKKLHEKLQPYGWTVDIYGSCGKLKCPTSNKQYDCGEMLKRDYFFYLSFENSFAEDYVTEKLLNALQNDVVPIVLGGADYNRFLPPGSYLDARKTSSHDLANIINKVISSPSLYNSFFKWKSLYMYSNPSKSDGVCALCAALNNETFFNTSSYYKNFRRWWHPRYNKRCKSLYYLLKKTFLL